MRELEKYIIVCVLVALPRLVLDAERVLLRQNGDLHDDLLLQRLVARRVRGEAREVRHELRDDRARVAPVAHAVEKVKSTAADGDIWGTKSSWGDESEMEREEREREREGGERKREREGETR